MARQVGFLKLQGTLDDTTFAKTKDGFLAKKKKREHSNRKTSKTYALSNQNAEEFGNASSSAKLIRTSVNQLTSETIDTAMMRKLTSSLSKIILLDKVGLRGKRMPTPENLKLLVGFSMNLSASLKAVFNSRFRTTANRPTGQFSISIPSFIPTDRIKIPKTATHFKIVSAVSAIDFVEKEYDMKYAESAMIELNETPTADIELMHQLTPGTPHPVFIFLGLQFWQIAQGETSSVSNKKMDPVGIVNVVID